MVTELDGVTYRAEKSYIVGDRALWLLVEVPANGYRTRGLLAFDEGGKLGVIHEATSAECVSRAHALVEAAA